MTLEGNENPDFYHSFPVSGLSPSTMVFVSDCDSSSTSVFLFSNNKFETCKIMYERNVIKVSYSFI